MQLITRKHKFDSAHRVMNERQKCFRMHGHLYNIHLIFSFEQMEEIGYPLDFKEIKRIGCSWIDDLLDHNTLLNPLDNIMFDACKKLGTDPWIMTLNDKEYCNPTVENIAKELFMAQEILFENISILKMHQIKLYETENCWTDCFLNSISGEERRNFYSNRYQQIKEYAESKGIFQYDDRKLKEIS